MRRSWLLTSLLIMGAAFASPARAAPASVKEQCVSRARDGQRARKAGKLIEAAAHFAECARPDCPSIIQNDCTQWSGEVDEATPTFVFAASDGAARDILDVSLEIDGRVVLTTLDGLVRPLDPGPHKVVFANASGARVKLDLLAQVGEKRRLVRVVLEAPRQDPVPKPVSADERPAPPPPRPKRSLVAPLVLGGVALGAFGAATFFQIVGSDNVAEARDRCGLNCSRAEVADLEARTSANEWAARAGIGVGVVALVVAGILLFTR